MDIEKLIIKTIRDYDLIKKSDKVIVALSGGKDSVSVLYILKKLGYNVEGLMIDLKIGKWSEVHLENMMKFCKENDVSLTVVDLKEEIGQGMGAIRDVLSEEKGMTGCSVCGIVKRWLLNRWARKMGGDVLVTGHNLDDESQNVLMNFLKGNVYLGANLAPATGGGVKSMDGFVQRVKPLFFVPEDEIKKYSEIKKFDILHNACPHAFDTYRVNTRKWMVDFMTNKEKLAVVEGFMKISSKLKGDDRELKRCEKCGEVSRGRICKACEIFSYL